MRKRLGWVVLVVLVVGVFCLIKFAVLPRTVWGNGYVLYGVNRVGAVTVVNKKLLDKVVATVRPAVPFPPWIVVIFHNTANPATDYAVNIPSRTPGRLPVEISGCTGLRIYAARSIAVLNMDIDVGAITGSYGADSDRLTNSVFAQCLDYATQGGEMGQSYEQVRDELFTVLREGIAIKLEQ